MSVMLKDEPEEMVNIEFIVANVRRGAWSKMESRHIIGVVQHTCGLVVRHV